MEEKEVTKKFNNWAEVNEWWTKNPTYIRVSPDFDCETIEEYNRMNHSIEFPCSMTFKLPE